MELEVFRFKAFLEKLGLSYTKTHDMINFIITELSYHDENDIAKFETSKLWNEVNNECPNYREFKQVLTLIDMMLN